jgi:hypothetical protein
MNGGEDDEIAALLDSGEESLGIVVEIDIQLTGEEVAGFKGGPESLFEGILETAFTFIEDGGGEVSGEEAGVELDEDGDLGDVDFLDEIVGDFANASDAESTEFDR